MIDDMDVPEPDWSRFGPDEAGTITCYYCGTERSGHAANVDLSQGRGAFCDHRLVGQNPCVCGKRALAKAAYSIKAIRAGEARRLQLAKECGGG